MKTSKLPHYMNSADPKRISEEEINNFTFSEVQFNDNPEKGQQESPEQTGDKQKVQGKGVEISEKKESEEREGSASHEQEGKQAAQTPKKEQIQSNEGSPQFRSKTERNQQSQNQDGSPRGYQQLTMKLQTALSKISAKKSLNKTSSQTSTIWRRAEECAEKKRKDLEKKRQQSQQMKKKQIKSKPVINKLSQKIVDKIGHQPIYSRYDKLVEAKKQREKEIEENKQKQKEEQEALFVEELNRHMRKPESVRNYTQYYEQMVKWKQQSTKHNRQKLQVKKAKELEGVTFKPVLNNKSKKMIASKDRLPIDQRGLVKDKSKNQYSFRPNVNHRVGK